jgi:hypothetical protein
MQKFFCDACNKEVSSSSMSSFYYRDPLSVALTDKLGTGAQEWDLCPECAEKVRRFIISLEETAIK